MIFNIETIAAMVYSKNVLQRELTYLPITFLDDVKPTCKNTVKGN